MNRLGDTPYKDKNAVEQGDLATASLTDEELLQGHRSGQKGAFETLMQRRGGELYRFLARYLGDRSLADDVFQDTFLQVHLSAESFDPTRRLKPWLFTIAANKARDALRTRSRRSATALDARVASSDEDSAAFVNLLKADVEAPGERLETAELRQGVQKVVLEMPEHLRDVLLLSYFHQFSYKEMADILGVPLGTVKSRLHAAVAYFARRWESIGKRFSND